MFDGPVSTCGSLIISNSVFNIDLIFKIMTAGLVGNVYETKKMASTLILSTK